jgi:hypothetical protein
VTGVCTSSSGGACWRKGNREGLRPMMYACTDGGERVEAARGTTTAERVTPQPRHPDALPVRHSAPGTRTLER